MKLLLDENVPYGYVESLKADGHDVKHITKTNKSMKDKDIYKIALNEKRLIITNDTDYNVYIYMNNYGIIKLYGIISNCEDKIKYIIQIYKLDKKTIPRITYAMYDAHYYKIIPKYSKKGKIKRPQKLKEFYKGIEVNDTNYKNIANAY